MKPVVFVVGAQKSGTSTLYRMLAEIPEVCGSVPKEPNFFSRRENLERPEDYWRHFDPASRERCEALLEASTSYLAEPYVPSRIAHALRERARLIAILRDPVDRTYSAYLHLVKRFDETRPFEAVVGGLGGGESAIAADEERRLEQAIRLGHARLDRYVGRYDDPRWPFRYVSNSYYTSAIRRYEALFGEDRLLLLRFTDLRNRPHETLRRVANFLQLSRLTLPDAPDLHANPTRLPRTGFVPRLTRRWAGRWMRDTPHHTTRLARALRRVAYRPPPSLPPRSRFQLESLFADEKRSLDERYGLRFEDQAPR